MHPAIDPAVPSESGEALDLLGMYFRDLGGIEVMSKDEEFAAATKIARLRTAFWRTLLGYLPFAAPICELAEALLPDESRPTEALKAMQKAARSLRAMREVRPSEPIFRRVFLRGIRAYLRRDFHPDQDDNYHLAKTLLAKAEAARIEAAAATPAVSA